MIKACQYTLTHYAYSLQACGPTSGIIPVQPGTIRRQPGGSPGVAGGKILFFQKKETVPDYSETFSIAILPPVEPTVKTPGKADNSKSGDAKSSAQPAYSTVKDQIFGNWWIIRFRVFDNFFACCITGSIGTTTETIVGATYSIKELNGTFKLFVIEKCRNK